MSMDELAVCPYCHREVPMALLFLSEEAHRAFNRLLCQGVPLGSRVMRYVTLFTPPKTRLTQGKQLKLIEQLLPDLERQAITVQGRDWMAPLALWNVAMEKMFAMADAGRLTLPLKGHAYLYTVLQELANTAAEEAEKKAEHDKRAAPRQGQVQVQVRGQSMSIGQGLQVMYGGKDPALADMDQRTQEAAKPSEEIRERIAAITGRSLKS